MSNPRLQCRSCGAPYQLQATCCASCGLIFTNQPLPATAPYVMPTLQPGQALDGGRYLIERLLSRSGAEPCSLHLSIQR